MSESNIRYPSCDYLRALAIISVVLYHFEYLTYGYLGVDLFFVLSGFLVSQSLIRQLNQSGQFSVSNFFLARTFRVWPMYFSFLLLGNAGAYFLYSSSHPNLYIPFVDLAKYVFFYANYRGTGHHIFDHIWTLCVEEHFYLALPAALFVMSKMKVWSGKNALLLLSGGILLGNLLRTLSYAIGFETTSATHNRIDALSWGVLLSVLVQNNIGTRFLKSKVVIFCGAIVLLGSIGLHAYWINELYRKVAFQSFTAFGFFLLLAGSLGFESRRLQVLRTVSKYSFGWYLWHLLLLYFAKDHFGEGILGFSVYAAGGFTLAVLSTHLIEVQFLKLKDRSGLRGFATQSVLIEPVRQLEKSAEKIAS